MRMGGAKKATKKKTSSKKASSKNSKRAQRKKKIPAASTDESDSTPESKASDKKDYKDLGMVYLAEGLNGVKTMIDEFGMKAATVRRAAKHVEAQFPAKADMFRKFVEKDYPATAKGRMAPVDGEVREYKPQSIKEGGPFLRLPLDLLGVVVKRDDEGEITYKDTVCVKFTKEKFEVWKKQAAG